MTVKRHWSKKWIEMFYVFGYIHTQKELDLHQSSHYYTTTVSKPSGSRILL